MTLPFTYSVLIGPMVMVWYILGELGSLAEHAVSMGASIRTAAEKLASDPWYWFSAAGTG